VRETTTASENAKQSGRTIAQSNTGATGVRTAMHKTARYKRAMRLRDGVTIPSYSM